MEPTNDLLYHEKLNSQKTQALFLGFTLLFLALFFWRINTGSLDSLAFFLLFLFLFFMFYTLNYKTLHIRLTPEQLKLRFGIISWKVPLNNIKNCRLDEDIPKFKKYGGAGMHFMVVHKRYRASFNFLEHPRVVVALKMKKGPVMDVSFSTSQPDEVIRLIDEHASY